MRVVLLLLALSSCKKPTIDWVDAPAGEVAELVAAEQTRAQAQGRQLIVYVGAKWCEPCRYFHDAVAKHELDAAFPTLRILAFDFDSDHDRLNRAGYMTQMLPSFSLPGPGGRSSGKHIEGSIKGPGAVANLTPRLKSILP